jgi:hypothetical protein
VTCPAGITRKVAAHNAVFFGAACRHCPLRGRCTTAKEGRTVYLHEHDGLLRAARAAWAAVPELRQDYMARRPHVERAIAQVATWRGRRLKLRYRTSCGRDFRQVSQTADMAPRGEASHRHRDRRRPASAVLAGAAPGRDRPRAGINEGRLATGAPRSVGITASRNNTAVMLP